jgi:SNF2 family DNA or RNA helicase
MSHDAVAAVDTLCTLLSCAHWYCLQTQACRLLIEGFKKQNLKTIVFSLSTQMLDILEMCMKSWGVR